MIENSNAYQVWVYDQIYPDETISNSGGIGITKHSFLKPKPEPREQETEDVTVQKEKEFLLKHGIDF